MKASVVLIERLVNLNKVCETQGKIVRNAGFLNESNLVPKSKPRSKPNTKPNTKPIVTRFGRIVPS